MTSLTAKDAYARTPVKGAYTGTARFLHWLIVALLIAQFIFAWTMPHIGRTVPQSILIDLHVWFGVAILFVAVLRLLWRVTHREPEPDDGLPPWQVASARAMHWALYVLLFAVPLIGWFNASWRGMPVTFFGLFELPKLIGTHVGDWHWTGDIHGFLANYVMLGLIGLHVAAALYHHFVCRDGVLRRMLPEV